jgi:hypothetical protein
MDKIEIEEKWLKPLQKKGIIQHQKEMYYSTHTEKECFLFQSKYTKGHWT